MTSRVTHITGAWLHVTVGQRQQDDRPILVSPHQCWRQGLGLAWSHGRYAMLVRRIDHTAVYVSDLDKSIEWYETVFGLSHAYRGDTGGGEPGAFFDVGDTILAML